MCEPIGKAKKISKLLNAFATTATVVAVGGGGKNKRSRREDLGEYKIFRTGRSRRTEGRERMRMRTRRKTKERKRRWREDRDDEDREKLIYVPCTYYAVCIFTDACTFAPRILESEKDDYLHRDTSSLNRLVYLLIYFSVALRARVRSLASP